MTESDWATCSEPDKMLRYLKKEWPTKASERKLRLFVCSCCRLTWHLMVLETAHTATCIAEEFADGHVDEMRRDAAKYSVNTGPHQLPPWNTASYLAVLACDTRLWDAAHQAAALSNQVRAKTTQLAHQANRDRKRTKTTLGNERRLTSHLLRCIFGNPSRPITLEASLSLAVVQMAQAIYEDRAFERMPVLGDALEESGVSDSELLAHCRVDTLHARGCHVIDAILQKK
jgi:hypothetical protein